MALAAIAAVAIVAVSAYVTFAQAPDPVVAKVNGVEVHQSDFAMAEEDVGQNLPQGGEDAKRDYLVSYLSDMILLAQAAEERRLQDDPDFKRRRRSRAQQGADGGAAAERGQGRSPTRPCAPSMTTPSSRWATTKRCNARHILLRVANPTDAKASKEAEDKVKAVIERLKKGEDFAKLANERPRIQSAARTAAISATSPRTRWCRSSPPSLSSSTSGAISDPIKTSPTRRA